MLFAHNALCYYIIRIDVCQSCLTFAPKIYIMRMISVECFCEVITINKRKFLTELGKLLTFMFEEDRQRALSVYESMFDEAEDDTALTQFLGSPTKQAVTVARAYNAKERRLAVTSQAGEGNADVVNDEEPGFVTAINRIRDAAVEQGIISDIAAGQYPVFEEVDTIPEDQEVPSENRGEEPSVQPEEPGNQEEEQDQQQEEPSPEAFEQEGQETERSEEERAFEELPVFTLENVEEEAAVQQDTEETEMDREDAEEGPEDDAAEFAETLAEIQQDDYAAGADEQEEDAAEEEFDNFQLDLGPIPEETRAEPEEIDEMMATFRGDREQPIPKPAPSAQTTLTEFEEQQEDEIPWRQVSQEDEAPAGRLSIARSILYLLVAVPVTTAGVLVLLVPTVLFLGLAVVVGVAAFRVATLAFNSFAVFADIIVVLGAALALLAVAIFLFWIFVSFIGGAIAGLINLAIRIGGKVCYREDKKA